MARVDPLRSGSGCAPALPDPEPPRPGANRRRARLHAVAVLPSIRRSYIGHPAAMGVSRSMVAFTARALHRGGWRYPALFALVVALTSGINASSIIYVGVAPVLWLVFAVAVEREGHLARGGDSGAEARALTVLCSFWWIAGLVVEAGYGVDVLRYTESLPPRARPPALLRSSAASVLVLLRRRPGSARGPGPPCSTPNSCGSWPSRTSCRYFRSCRLVVRWRYRVVLRGPRRGRGMVLSVGAHPYSSPTPAGGVLKQFMSHTTAGLALRSTDRATPLVVLGIAMLLGAGISAVRASASRRAWSQLDHGRSGGGRQPCDLQRRRRGREASTPSPPPSPATSPRRSPIWNTNPRTPRVLGDTRKRLRLLPVGRHRRHSPARASSPGPSSPVSNRSWAPSRPPTRSSRWTTRSSPAQRLGLTRPDGPAADAGERAGRVRPALRALWGPPASLLAQQLTPDADRVSSTRWTSEDHGRTSRDTQRSTSRTSLPSQRLPWPVTARRLHRHRSSTHHPCRVRHGGGGGRRGRHRPRGPGGPRHARHRRAPSTTRGPSTRRHTLQRSWLTAPPWSSPTPIASSFRWDTLSANYGETETPVAEPCKTDTERQSHRPLPGCAADTKGVASYVGARLDVTASSYGNPSRTPPRTAPTTPSTAISTRAGTPGHSCPTQPDNGGRPLPSPRHDRPRHARPAPDGRQAPLDHPCHPHLRRRPVRSQSTWAPRPGVERPGHLLPTAARSTPFGSPSTPRATTTSDSVGQRRRVRRGRGPRPTRGRGHPDAQRPARRLRNVVDPRIACRSPCHATRVFLHDGTDPDSTRSRRLDTPDRPNFTLSGNAALPLSQDDEVDQLVGRPGSDGSGVVATSEGRLPGDLRARRRPRPTGTLRAPGSPVRGGLPEGGWLEYDVPQLPPQFRPPRPADSRRRSPLGPHLAQYQHGERRPVGGSAVDHRTATPPGDHLGTPSTSPLYEDAASA